MFQGDTVPFEDNLDIKIEWEYRYGDENCEDWIVAEITTVHIRDFKANREAFIDMYGKHWVVEFEESLAETIPPHEHPNYRSWADEHCLTKELV